MTISVTKEELAILRELVDTALEATDTPLLQELRENLARAFWDASLRSLGSG